MVRVAQVRSYGVATPSCCSHEEGRNSLNNEDTVPHASLYLVVRSLYTWLSEAPTATCEARPLAQQMTDGTTYSPWSTPCGLSKIPSWLKIRSTSMLCVGVASAAKAARVSMGNSSRRANYQSNRLKPSSFQ